MGQADLSLLGACLHGVGFFFLRGRRGCLGKSFGGSLAWLHLTAAFIFVWSQLFVAPVAYLGMAVYTLCDLI